MAEVVATMVVATMVVATMVVATMVVATKREKNSTMAVADMADMAGMVVAGTDRLATTLTTSGKYRHACYTLPLIIPMFYRSIAEEEKGEKGISA